MSPTDQSIAVVVAHTRQLDFVSAINGASYRLQIAAPYQPAPAGGYPVLYVLDGYWFFSTITDSTRLRKNNAIAAPLVVGIAYPGDDPEMLQERRALDLTPTDRSASDPLGGAFQSYKYGGLDRFLDILESEVRPLVAEHQPIDDSQSALFGSSFGGLAVLHALFTRPDAYRTFLAIEPSIFFGDGAVLRNEPEFTKRVEAHEVAPRAYIAVAGRYDMPSPKRLEELGVTADEYRASVATVRMALSASELAARLQSLNGPPGFSVRFDAFPEDTHASAPYSALQRAIEVAFAI